MRPSSVFGCCVALLLVAVTPGFASARDTTSVLLLPELAGGNSSSGADSIEVRRPGSSKRESGVPQGAFL